MLIWVWINETEGILHLDSARVDFATLVASDTLREGWSFRT